jgi:hypothetical protein
MNSSKIRRMMIVALSVAILLIFPSGTITARQILPNPDPCKEGAWSSEVDFWSRGAVPFDGNAYVSDGDLLGRFGDVCARNADLLSSFGVKDDLGLDAVDIYFEIDVVAFSTELDAPDGAFTAGDLLTNTGIIIPNAALIAPLGISYDVGLDGLQFIGEPDVVKQLLDKVTAVSRTDWLSAPLMLQEILNDLSQQSEIDVWFSIEGNWPAGGLPTILDGDVLSARDGSIVLTQGDLLSPFQADFRPGMNGYIDYGLDALAAPRNGEKGKVLFSTEVLNLKSFTDGDVLALSGGIVVLNTDLSNTFFEAEYLGMDALWWPF